MKVTQLLVPGLLLVLFSSLAQATVVQDFESGTIAPGTLDASYSNLTPCSGGGTLYPEASVAVTTSAAPCHNLWYNVGPQDGSYYLAINGKTAIGPIYEQTVGGLIIGHTYDLTGWFSGLYNVNPANIAWDITAGGVAPVNSFLTNITGDWEQNGITFVATGTSLTFNIGISTTEASGNDFGLDTIELTDRTASEVPEPATFFLVGVVLSGLGILRRKR